MPESLAEKRSPLLTPNRGKAVNLFFLDFYVPGKEDSGYITRDTGMVKRKLKLINPDFQLRTIFTIIGITTIAFLVLVAVAGINAFQNNRKIASTVSELNEAIALQDSIVNNYIDRNGITGEGTLDRITADYNKSIGIIRRYIGLLYSFARQNFNLISLIIGVVFIQGVLLYFYLLKLTHRISGPIFVMTRHIQDIMEGKEPQFRELRDKDEFKDFYTHFVNLAGRLMKEKGKDQS